jgi:hypothetical protein
MCLYRIIKADSRLALAAFLISLYEYTRLQPRPAFLAASLLQLFRVVGMGLLATAAHRGGTSTALHKSHNYAATVISRALRFENVGHNKRVVIDVKAFLEVL